MKNNQLTSTPIDNLKQRDAKKHVYWDKIIKKIIAVYKINKMHIPNLNTTKQADEVYYQGPWSLLNFT